MYKVMINYGVRGDNLVKDIEFRDFSTFRKAKQYVKICAENSLFLSGEVKDKNSVTKFRLWWNTAAGKVSKSK